MTIAVLGAGIQGCSVAIELAEAGYKVEIFDKSALPMSHSSRWNEGKLHLGYVYAKDASLKTAEAMVDGSLAFSQFIRRHLACELAEDKQSSTFVYGVHRDSLLSPQTVQAHFQAVDQIISKATRASDTHYLGLNKVPSTRKLKTADYFNPELVKAAFATPERSVDTNFLADRISDVIFQHPLIDFIGRKYISSIAKKDKRTYTIVFQDGTESGGYRHVVNTTWEDRLRIDQSLGYLPDVSWLYRYKLAIHLQQPDMASNIPSSTFLLGPFGDLVNFGNGKYYLSWYPSCCIAFSNELRPHDLKIDLTPERLKLIAGQTGQRLAELIPPLKHIKYDYCDVEIKGGFICAIGTEDINRESSQLHQRHQGGVWSNDGYHSVFTGKYTSAPLHAKILRKRIAG
jgi:hypothetical protein